MAEVLVQTLVSNLTGLVQQEAKRIANVKDTIKSLEKEVLLINALIISLEVTVELAPDAAKWMQQASLVACRAEDLISQYEKSLAKTKGAAIFKWKYLKERHNLALELEKVTLDIQDSSEQGKHILTIKNLDLPLSSQEDGGSISYSAALYELNDFLSRNHWLYSKRLFESLEMIRSEMAPLDKFLGQVGSEAELDERQKVWVKEIRDIFQLLEEALLSLQGSRSFRGLAPQIKLQNKIRKIEKRIAAVTRRYDIYAIGEFRVRGGLRSIIPRIRRHIKVEPVGSRSMMAEVLTSGIPAVIDKIFRKSSVSISEQFLDLKLMKALFEDASKMEDSDKRVKVWLEQMGEIYYRLLTLDAYTKEISKGRMGVRKILALPWIVRETKEIEKEINDLSIRKLRYDIGSFVAEDVNGEVQSITRFSSGQSTSSGKLREQIRLMKELQLIDALLEDINIMEKIDARLKVWLQEILGVAREAKAIIEQDFRGISGRIKLARNMYRIKKWIDHISQWKRTYDIREIKATNASSTVGQDLEAAEAYPFGSVRAEFESLRRELKLMKAFDDDIQELFHQDGRLEVWMEEMRDVAKDAQKFIDEHGDITSKGGILQLLIIEEKRSCILHIKDKIQKLHERRIRYGIEQINGIPENIDDQVASMLLSNIRHLCLLPILDLKGTGNATLLQLIKHNNTILAHFDWCVWVTIPEEFSSLSILRAITEQVKEQEEKSRENTVIESLVLRPRPRQEEIWCEEDELMQKMEGILSQKKYLIVLDGIQIFDAWHYLQKVFPDASNGSRIVLATGGMSESKWKQLCQNLSSDKQMYQRGEVERQGEFQVLTPLKIGGLPPENETASERLLMQLNEEEASQPESFTVRPENAPSYLWRCLFYFLLFPAGIEIPARRLIAIWVAEGIVGPKRGENKPAEYFCELKLSQLIRLRMIKATKMKENGKVMACQLCDDKRETLLKMAEEVNFFQAAPAAPCRLVVHHANRNTSYGHIDGSKPCSSSVLKEHYKRVISFLSFDTEEGGKHGDNIGNFLHRCISNRCLLSLRVLDLEGVFKPKLPPALGLLTGLRYLGLRWTYLECLPDHVSKLLNLQVLDVKRTYISSLPKSIWNMQYLRHLYLSEAYRSRFVSRPRNKSLRDLLTLWGAFIDKDSPVLNGLDTILNIRKLGLTCRSMSSADEMKSQLEAVGDWILELKDLEDLRLKSFDDLGNPSDLHLKPLKGHNNLSRIYLVGRLRYPSIVSEFPIYVTDITLSGSELIKDPMIALQSLEKLMILRLFSRSTTCRTMRCTKGGFPQLRDLKIWNLEHLEEWEVEEGALPSLKDLEIRNCQNLKMVPYELTQRVSGSSSFQISLQN